MLTRYGILVAGLTLLAACGASAPSQPTTAPGKAPVTQATPAAPSVAATVQAAAPTLTAVVPTAQAVATQVAGTAVPAATAAAPVVGTAVASAPMQIVDAKLGLTDTTLTVRNTSQTAIDLNGWAVKAGESTAALPSNMRVAPGGILTLHLADGTSTGSDVYLGTAATASLLTNLRPGSKVALVDGQGRVMTEFTLAA